MTNSSTSRVTKTSMITGITRTLEIKHYTQDEFNNRYKMWESGELLIQEAFPELNNNVREFIKTGVTEEEWEREFGDV